jgi:hypothetical protein
MSNGVMELAQTVGSMRSVVPAKTFEISKRFYVDPRLQAPTADRQSHRDRANSESSKFPFEFKSAIF